MIEIFSLKWKVYSLMTVIFIILPIIIPLKYNEKAKYNIAKVFGGFIILELILFYLYHYYNNIFSLQESLPLHLCRIMWIISLFAIFKKSNTSFEMLFHIGIFGSFYALLTPDLANDANFFLTFNYYFTHGGIIFVALYCLINLGMRPRNNSWFNVIFYVNILAFFISIINYIIGSNYMYLSSKPGVENPLLFLDWPYYILIFEIGLFFHSFLIHILYNKFIKRHLNKY